MRKHRLRIKLMARKRPISRKSNKTCWDFRLTVSFLFLTKTCRSMKMMLRAQQWRITRPAIIQTATKRELPAVFSIYTVALMTKCKYPMAIQASLGSSTHRWAGLGKVLSKQASRLFRNSWKPGKAVWMMPNRSNMHMETSIRWQIKSKQDREWLDTRP